MYATSVLLPSLYCTFFLKYKQQFKTKLNKGLRTFLFSRGFAHARGFRPHASHPQIIISYVYLLQSAINACRMRSAVRGVTHCGDSACVSVPTTLVSILEWDGAHAPYYTNDCPYRHATRRKQKLKLRVIRSVKFHACGPIPRGPTMTFAE
jgi:hypothetical protein